MYKFGVSSDTLSIFTLKMGEIKMKWTSVDACAQLFACLGLTLLPQSINVVGYYFHMQVCIRIYKANNSINKKYSLTYGFVLNITENSEAQAQTPLS